MILRETCQVGSLENYAMTAKPAGTLCLVAVSGVREGDARVPGILTRGWFRRC